LGAFKSGGHGNFEVGDGRLQDLGGVSRDVLGLSQVNLFGDDGFGFVEGGDIGYLGLSDMRSGEGDDCGYVSNSSCGLSDNGFTNSVADNLCSGGDNCLAGNMCSGGSVSSVVGSSMGGNSHGVS